MPKFIATAVGGAVLAATVLSSALVAASPPGPTGAELRNLVAAEGKVKTLAQHYAPTAAWSAAFKAADAKQQKALTAVNAALGTSQVTTSTTSTTQPSGQVLLQSSGSTSGTSGSFVAPAGGWTVDYVVSCPAGDSAFIGAYEGTVLKAKDSPGEILGTSQQGTLHNTATGTFHFQVITFSCTWSIEVLSGIVGTAGIS